MDKLSKSSLQTYSTRLKKLPNVKKAKIAHRRGQKAFYTYLGSKAKTSGLYRSYSAVFKPETYEQVLDFMRKEAITPRAEAKRLLRGKMYKAKETIHFKSRQHQINTFKPITKEFNELYLHEIENQFKTLYKTNISKRMFKKPFGSYGFSSVIDIKYDVYDIITGKRIGVDNWSFGRKLYADNLSLKNDFEKLLLDYEKRFNLMLRSVLFVIKRIRVYIQFYELLV